MIQIANSLFNLIVFVEVLYIYTCGQEYVRTVVKHVGRSFEIDRIIFMVIGLVAMVTPFEVQEVSYTQTVMSLMIAVFFGRKCQSIYRYVQINKERKKRLS